MLDKDLFACTSIKSCVVQKKKRYTVDLISWKRFLPLRSRSAQKACTLTLWPTLPAEQHLPIWLLFPLNPNI